MDGWMDGWMYMYIYMYMYMYMYVCVLHAKILCASTANYTVE